MEIEIDKDYTIRKLRRWLNFELSTTVLLFLQYSGFTLILVVLAAIIFTPIMLKALYDEERFGWLIFFGIIVGIPLLALPFFINTQWFGIVAFVPLGSFYFYCFLLRLVIMDW